MIGELVGVELGLAAVLEAKVVERLPRCDTVGMRGEPADDDAIEIGLADHREVLARDLGGLGDLEEPEQPALPQHHARVRGVLVATAEPVRDPAQPRHREPVAHLARSALLEEALGRRDA